MKQPLRYNEPKRGDIYQTDLGGNFGIRPTLIIQNDVGNKFSDNVIVVPITSRKKKPMPTHVYIPVEAGLHKPGTALCETIMTISKQNLLSWMGGLGYALREIHRQGYPGFPPTGGIK